VSSFFRNFQMKKFVGVGFLDRIATRTQKRIVGGVDEKGGNADGWAR
jgi:hypothetical protein